jgi:hypothetical protein
VTLAKLRHLSIWNLTLAQLLALTVFAGAVRAQDLPSGVQLGMTTDELRTVLPEAERVARPQRLAGGLAGSWRGPSVRIADLDFAMVLFFAGNRLGRVEYVATVRPDSTSAQDPGETAFAALVEWGRVQFGGEMRSNDPGSAYATWVRGDADIYAQRTFGARAASVQLVYKLRQLKEGSSL